MAKIARENLPPHNNHSNPRRLNNFGSRQERRKRRRGLNYEAIDQTNMVINRYDDR
jgi:hypothetical protein